jgi:hypothetical protein
MAGKGGLARHASENAPFRIPCHRHLRAEPGPCPSLRRVNVSRPLASSARASSKLAYGVQEPIVAQLRE